MRKPVVMVKPGVIIEKERLEELWNAANCHCAAMTGQYLAETDGPPDDWDWDDGDWNPPMPENPGKVIDLVIKYLTESI